jgi:uncharacterized protein YoxC
MVKYVSLIIAAVFNIVSVILKAAGQTAVSEVLYEVMPYVDTLAIAVMGLLGYTEYRKTRSIPK